MTHNLPSVKTLREIAHERAGELRKVLQITKRSQIEALLDTGKYPVTERWYGACLFSMGLQLAKLSIASEITNCHGVEYIPAGSTADSPAIEYVNAGDTYATTLLYVSGRGYKVGCWGDIVERGNYA